MKKFNKSTTNKVTRKSSQTHPILNFLEFAMTSVALGGYTLFFIAMLIFIALTAMFPDEHSMMGFTVCTSYLIFSVVILWLLHGQFKEVRMNIPTSTELFAAIKEVLSDVHQGGIDLVELRKTFSKKERIHRKKAKIEKIISQMDDDELEYHLGEVSDATPLNLIWVFISSFLGLINELGKAFTGEVTKKFGEKSFGAFFFKDGVSEFFTKFGTYLPNIIAALTVVTVGIALYNLFTRKTAADLAYEKRLVEKEIERRKELKESKKTKSA